jgi:hypothetical protein
MRSGGFRVRIGVAIAATLWPLLAAAAPPSVTGIAATRSAAPAYNEVALRQLFGLRNDLAYLAHLHATLGASPGHLAFERYGILMTPQEQAEIDFRSGPLQKAASDPRLASYLNETPEFAGKYIDHELGGKLVVLFTANVDQHVGTLTQLFPYQDRLVVRTASHSIRTLEALHQQVDGDTPSLAKEGISVATTGVDVPHNRLNVTVTHLDQSVRTVFAAKYGKDAPIKLSQGPFARREGGRGTDAPPFRGGQELDRIRASDQTAIICTSGYVIRQYTGGLTSPYTYWLTTAGHCGPAGVQWTQGGVLVGNEQFGTYGVGAYSSNSDVAIIPIPSVTSPTRSCAIPGYTTWFRMGSR